MAGPRPRSTWEPGTAPRWSARCRPTWTSASAGGTDARGHDPEEARGHLVAGDEAPGIGAGDDGADGGHGTGVQHRRLARQPVAVGRGDAVGRPDHVHGAAPHQEVEVGGPPVELPGVERGGPGADDEEHQHRPEHRAGRRRHQVAARFDGEVAGIGPPPGQSLTPAPAGRRGGRGGARTAPRRRDRG